MKNIVLNIPHSSINGIYDEKHGKWCKSPLFINNIVNKWTDWYTDYLFSVDNSNIKKVVFPYSRFVCDAERLESDEMEKIGQGIAYTSFNDYRRTISEEEKERIIGLWKEHQNKLVECIDKDTVLIDCHSFPSEFFESRSIELDAVEFMKWVEDGTFKDISIVTISSKLYTETLETETMVERYMVTGTTLDGIMLDVEYS